MRRRVLLGALAGTVGLAGCAGDPTSGSPSAGDSPAGSPKGTPTASATPTRAPGTVPPDRTVASEAVASDGLAARAERWFGLERVRYRDPDTGDLAWVGAPEGRFVAYEFRLRNAGEESLPAVRDGRFRLRVAGTGYEHVHRLPGGVSFHSLAQPEGRPTIRSLAWYDGLAPGATVDLQLVFQAPVEPSHRHYLAWDPGAEVDGSSDPVYLYPQ